MWVLPKPGEVIFYWRPEHPSALNPLDWDEVHLSAIHTILSALWRDLVVGGEQVFLSQNASVYRRQTFDRLRVATAQMSASQSPLRRFLPPAQARPGRALPGNAGEVENPWAPVRGHVRRLLPGQRRAHEGKTSNLWLSDPLRHTLSARTPPD
jgi:hypothetical protein